MGTVAAPPPTGLPPGGWTPEGRTPPGRSGLPPPRPALGRNPDPGPHAQFRPVGLRLARAPSGRGIPPTQTPEGGGGRAR